MNIPVRLNSLEGTEGWVLAESISNPSGQILCQAGVLLDQNTIFNLKKFFLKHGDTGSGTIIRVKYNEQTMTDEQRLYCESLIEQNCDVQGTINEEIHENVVNSLQNIYSPTNKQIKDALDVVDKCAFEITRNIQLSQDFSFSLGQYKNINASQSVYEHSFRVAQFAVTLAKLYNDELNTSDEKLDLKTVSTAALLHDYGMCFQNLEMMKKISFQDLGDSFKSVYSTIPEDVLYKPYNETYRNLYAYFYLKNQLDSITSSSILLSGESENGRGNCMHIGNNKNNKASMIAKIIFLCNLYDSLLTSVISKQESLENVSSTIETLIVNGAINKQLGLLLLNNIPIYSVGVRVQLSTGEYATVIQRFKGRDAAKPIVKTLVNPPLKPNVIDLRNTTTVTISQIVPSNATLDEAIKEFTNNQLQSIGVVSVEDNIIPFDEPDGETKVNFM